jgi:hypothetical protein
MGLLAVIFERTAVRKILSQLGLPSEPPAIARARASPEPHRSITLLEPGARPPTPPCWTRATAQPKIHV